MIGAGGRAVRAGPRRGPLRAVELAEAAALGDLAAAAVVLGRLVPLGPVPFGAAAFAVAVLAHRRRARAGIAAAVTAGTVTFLAVGPGSVGTAVAAAAVGTVVGIGVRRSWSPVRTAVTGVALLTVPAAAVAVGLLAALTGLRELLFAQVADIARGVARLFGGGTAEPVPSGVVTVLDAWWVWLPATLVVVQFGGLLGLAALFARPVRRLAARLPTDDAPRTDEAGETAAPVSPLPLSLRGAGIDGDGHALLDPVDLDLTRGRFVVVVGANGTGKSTLGQVIAGRPPDRGRAERPGAAGLGAPGGTALLSQRPESQVLGVRVGDDVRWGAPDGTAGPDVERLLARVGLGGLAERETSTLSGGQLQRLAVAALLARDPAVVVSDEATAMLDAAGRDDVLAVLHDLASEGAAVVHITHHADEVAGVDPADVVRLGPEPDPASAAPPVAPSSAGTGGRLRVEGADVVHDRGTPWERVALRDVRMDVPAGSTVLVTGPNGAGKSTLARLLAGLTEPTRGRVLLDGEPLRNGRDGALLAVQHARQALFGVTVGDDVADAAGADPDEADRALESVGLDPGRYRDRSVDVLSGGETRRVLLAGLLTARPRVLVLDEPLAGLDDDAAVAVRAALRAVRAAGTTLVVVTHDVDALCDLADDVVTVHDATVSVPPRLRVDSPAPAGRRRGPSPRRAMRTLPGTSPAHRAPAGLKLGVLVALAVLLAAVPSWWTLGGAAAVLAGWVVLGRVPPRAWPRPPWWLLLWLPVVALSGLGGGPPTVEVAGVGVGLGGVTRMLLLLGSAAAVVVGALLLVATTPLGAFPPLLAAMARVPARTGLPAVEWAVAVTLGLRLAPLLRDEAREAAMLLGQRSRSRAGGRRPRRRRVRTTSRRGVAAVAAVCVHAIRRAREVGDALTARGGPASAVRR